MAELNIEKMAQNVAQKVIQELRDNGVFIGRWIPVSERLPETGDYVLCSIADHYSKHKILISQYNREDFWSNGIIEAWMPLPKPYDPQESEDNEE